MVWAFTSPGGEIVVYDEFPNFPFQGAKDSNDGVEDYAGIFKTKEAGRKISARILDRHYGFKRQTLGGKTLAEEFEDVGLDYDPSYHVGENIPEVETGIAKVKDYLRYDKDKPISSLNRPKLLISPNCTNTIHALERWSRNPKTAKPQEEYKDFADCVRYLVMSEPTHEDSVVWADRRRPHFGVNT